jgi:hypothetical protein
MKLYDAGFTFVWRHRINVSKLTSRTMLMALDLPTFDFGVIHTSGALITNFHVCNVDVRKSDFRQFSKISARVTEVFSTTRSAISLCNWCKRCLMLPFVAKREA